MKFDDLVKSILKEGLFSKSSWLISVTDICKYILSKVPEGTVEFKSQPENDALVFSIPKSNYKETFKLSKPSGKLIKYVNGEQQELISITDLSNNILSTLNAMGKIGKDKFGYTKSPSK